jgi:hypothetical protein
MRRLFSHDDVLMEFIGDGEGLKIKVSEHYVVA